jgi:hypothetical protein
LDIPHGATQQAARGGDGVCLGDAVFAVLSDNVEVGLERARVGVVALTHDAFYGVGLFSQLLGDVE